MKLLISVCCESHWRLLNLLAPMMKECGSSQMLWKTQKPKTHTATYLDNNVCIFISQVANIRVNPSPTSERCNSRLCAAVTQPKYCKWRQQKFNLKKKPQQHYVLYYVTLREKTSLVSLQSTMKDCNYYQGSLTSRLC